MPNKERSRQPASGSWLPGGRQPTPKSTTKAHHHREPSLSSLGPAAPTSPYTTSILNPNVPENFSGNRVWIPGKGSNPLPAVFKVIWLEGFSDFYSRHPRSNMSSIYEDGESEKIPSEKIEAQGEKNWNILKRKPDPPPFTRPERTFSKAKHFKRKAIRVAINGNECYARPDSASDQDIMTKAFAKEHNIPFQREEHDTTFFKLGTGNFVQSIGRAYVPFKLFGRGYSEEHRWFHVLKKCPVPLIVGMGFLEKIKLYSKNKHLLVDCPSSFGSMPMFQWVGSPRGSVNFNANGKELVGCADTGSDLDFMSIPCARRLGLKVDTKLKARTRVMLADESIVGTVGQVTVSSIELSNFNNFKLKFHILPGLVSDVIFSEAFLDETDAFNTCVHIKDSEDSYHNLVNTLMNLGPIQAWLSSKWTPDVVDTVQQEHDRVVEAEHYRRNKANRTIKKMRDESRAAAAREAEEANQHTFNTGHARCRIVLGRDIGHGRRTGAF